MKNSEAEIYPGTRVMVYDFLPKFENWFPATVIRRYGIRSNYNPKWIYPDLIDVKFDHREEISKAHFTDCVKLIDKGK